MNTYIHRLRQPEPWRRRATAVAAVAVLMCTATAACATVTLTDHFSQATYDVDVRPGSQLRGASGFSGVGITSYSTVEALTGDGVILQAFPGEFVTRTQTLKLHFQAKPGHHFETVSMSHLLSYFNDRGGFRAFMSWTMDPEDSAPQTGGPLVYEDGVWSHGGSFSDLTQFSPNLVVDDDAFDLDVTLFYTSGGAPGGCGTGTGACQQLSANAVKVFATTAPGDDIDDPVPVPVPAPSTLALLLGAGLAQLRRRRSSKAPHDSSAASASGARPSAEAQRA